MGEGYHINPEEWGKHQQLITVIHEAITGEGGVLAQLKTLNSRTGKNETDIAVLKSKPSPMKIVLAVGAVITVVNAAIAFLRA